MNDSSGAAVGFDIGATILPVDLRNGLDPATPVLAAAKGNDAGIVGAAIAGAS